MLQEAMQMEEKDLDGEVAVNAPCSVRRQVERGRCAGGAYPCGHWG